MSRRSILLLICLVALLGTALVPWTLPSGQLDQRVQRELAAEFGLKAELAGRVTFALLPVPRVKFGEVRLLDEDGRELVAGAQLRGELRIGSLLLGRIEFSEISLADGRIALDWRPDGSALWKAPFLRVSERLERRAGGSTLRRLILTGMTVNRVDGASGPTPWLRSANLVVGFPGRQPNLDVSGSAIWRGESVDLSMSEVDPGALAAGRPSPISLRLKSQPLDATLAGNLTWAARGPRVSGTFTADMPSLRTALAWSGYAAPGTDRALSTSGDITAEIGEIELPRMRAALGTEQIDGALSLRLQGARPALTGTLAGDNLDLSPLANDPAEAGSPHAAIGLRDLTALDLDLRLSASAATLGRRLTLSDVAVGILTGPDRVDVNLGRATLGGGTVKGRLTVGQDEGGCDIRGQATFNRVDLAQLPAEIGALRVLSGTASGQASVETNGASAEALMRNAAGQAAVTVQDGLVSGVALAEGLRPNATPATLAGGRTPFRQFQAAVTLGSGSAELVGGALDSALLHSDLSGTASLPDGGLRMKARTAPPGDTGAGYTLAVTGPWRNPALTIEDVRRPPPAR